MSLSHARQSKISDLIKRLQEVKKKHGDLYCQGRNPSMIDTWFNPVSEEQIKLEVDSIYPSSDYKDHLVVFIEL
jgi:hypothetical protein